MAVVMEPVAQADVDAALAEVKAWLRIERAADDAELADLVRAAIGHAEDFCGQVMLARNGTERIDAGGEWRRMIACPVRVVSAAAAAPDAGGAAVPLAADTWRVEIDASGDAFVRRLDGAAGVLALSLTAGVADDWAGLPQAVRQGIVRLAAHLFAERADEAPPAIITALWRPWRRMRIA